MAKTMKATIELGGKLDGSLLKSMASAEKQLGALKKSTAGIRKVGKVAAAAVAGAVAAAGAATVKVVKDSIDAGKNFDSSMSQVAATMGTTVDQIGNLREFAIQMGETTKYSAQEAADALNYMALAGYDADKSMAMLPNVLNLAAAGNIDLAYASDMVTDASSALGLTTEETSAMIDKMAKASSKSNTSVQQLGEAILVVGGTAKNVAGGTTELSTALGVLANNGIKGTEGGTHLRNMLLSLQSPTDKAAVALEDLGVHVFDDLGRLNSLGDIFGELNGQLSQMTDEDKVLVLSDLFNKTDLSAAQAMLAGTVNSVEDLKISIRAMGVASDDAALTSFTLQGGFDEVAAAAEAGADAASLAQQMIDNYGLSAETAATVSEQLASAVSGEANDFDKLFADIEGAWYSLDSLSKSVQNAGLDIDGMRSSLEALGVTSEEFDAALGQSAGKADDFSSLLLDAADAGTSMNKVTAALGGDLNNLQAAFDETTGAAQAMADTQLDNLAGDLTILDSALGTTKIRISDAVTPALREFVQLGTKGVGDLNKMLASPEFKEWAASIATDVTGALRGAFEALMDVKAGFEEGFDAGGFAGALDNLGSAIAGAFGDGSDAPAAKGFGGALASALNGAANAIRMVTPIIGGAARAVKLLADNGGIVIPVIGGIVGAMAGFKAAMGISAAIQAVTTALGLATGAAEGMTVAQTVLNAVMEANPFVLVATLIAGLVAALAAAYVANEDFRNAVNAAFGAIGEFVGSVIEGIGSLLGDFCGWLVEAAGAVADFAGDVADFFGGLADDAGVAFDAIGSVISEDLETAQTAGSAAADALGAALAGDWDTAAQKTVEAYTTIQTAISDKVTAAGQVAGNVADAIGNALGFPGLGNTVRGVFDAVSRAITDPIGTARDFVRNIPGEIVGFFSGIGQRITNAIGSIHFPQPKVSWENLDIGGVASIPIPHITWLASGGFTDGPIAIAGEAGTEAVLSFDPRYRAANIGYWIQAGQMLGVLRAFSAGGFTDGSASDLSIDLASPTGSLATAAAATGAPGATTIDFGGVTFAPQVTVSGEDAGDVMEQLRAQRDEFMDEFERWIEERTPDYGYVF